MGHRASAAAEIRVTCAACGRGLHVPEKLAGRRVMCPRCGEVVTVPWPEESLAGGPAGSAAVTAPGPGGGAAGDLEHAPPATRLGVMALGLGLLAVLVLCVPVVGYGSLALSGLGLILGLWGLVRALRRDGSDPAAAGLGARGLRYPLAGTLACLVALALALLPLLLRAG